MKKAIKKPLVVFNASVIIAGLYSPGGGSGKLLRWLANKKINGVISEIILDEVVRNINQIKKSRTEVEDNLLSLFRIVRAAGKNKVEKYFNLVVDKGDAHLLATALEIGAEFLVSLDKKHILILKNKIKTFKIVSPKELIECYR